MVAASQFFRQSSKHATGSATSTAIAIGGANVVQCPNVVQMQNIRCCDFA